ncbi:MAG: hypothetical protein AB1384_06970 [Actinomycetota bacterium]
MSISKGGVATVAAACLLAACLCLSFSGCGGVPSREEVERIDTTFRAGTSSIVEATAFIAALEKFDFENAAFYTDTMSALDSSRAAAQKLLASVEEMGTFDYGGGLAPLGKYVEEYVPRVVEAVEELDGIYVGLQGILEAIEPVLREEAVITQLEAPGDDAELLERLRRLDAALAASLAELPGIEVPDRLREYKALLEGIFTDLHKVVLDLIAMATGQAPSLNPENNPDFLSLQEQLEDYPGVVGKIEEGLEIYRIDPQVEKVELEINRLFLGEER